MQGLFSLSPWINRVHYIEPVKLIRKGRDAMKENVVRIGVLDMQVCVPKKWKDREAIEFAESENPCGATNGWQIRSEGNELLNGSPERIQCSMYPGNVHIVLDTKPQSTPVTI